MRVEIDSEDLAALLNIAEGFIHNFGDDERFTQRQTYAAIEAGKKALESVRDR